ncbi:MAG: phosphatase PAP2 family protein [Chitinophagaceae bacterium]
MPLLDWLERLDKIVFLLIHHDADSTFLDQLLPLFRNPLNWLPLYGSIFYFIYSGYKDKSWQFTILSILTVAMADRLSAGIFKPLFERPRPCFDTELQPYLRELVNCGGLFSFPSSHAANHFGLASFWYGSIKILTGRKWNWLWIWSILIGYAQVYVGKHYPLDIAAGSLLGLLIGGTLSGIFGQWNTWKKSYCNDLFKSEPV